MNRKYIHGQIVSICFIIIFIMTFSIVFSSPLSARVTGVCSTCHTMHNSQNGSQVARTGSGAGWNAGNQLTGGSLSGPQDSLLISNCVGCHSSTTTNKIISVGGNTIPIVYNTVDPTGQGPSKTLAGGNFYWVATGGGADDSKGHNVYGISNPDADLSQAPGLNTSGCGDSNSCHKNLAEPPAVENFGRGACEACHIFTYHHEDNDVYRFLKGHGIPAPITLTDARKDISTYTDYVEGKEDPDWEFTANPSTGDHNFYKGTINSYNSDGDGLQNENSITSFCAGCHRVFHENMSSSGAWIRHPSDAELPEANEYDAYNPVTNYSVEAPVAWVDPDNPLRAQAIVMCLSCHRAHASDQPDMLRWPYSDMQVGTTDPSKAGTGCFTCHTEKDGV